MSNISLTASINMQTPLDQAFAKNIIEISSLGQKIHRLWSIPRATRKLIGTDVDELAKGKNLVSALKNINLSLMRMSRPSKDIAVVATARNEGPYLIEWIAHNICIGFEHIFIYTNDNTDKSDVLLHLLHKEGVITLIENEVSSSVSPQIKSYEHSIHLLRELRDFEWVAYFDIDEFLVVDKKYNFSVKDFLLDMRRHMVGSRPGAIFVHWDWYGSGGAISYERGFVQERFRVRKDYGVIKSIVHLPSISHMDDVHIPDHDLLFINSAFRQAYTINYACEPIEYSGARLNHYFHKSFQEFVLKKKRGSGLALDSYNPRELDVFFEWEPLAGVNAEISGTPPDLISLVKSEAEKIRAIAGIADAEEATLEAHMNISKNIFGGSIKSAYNSTFEALLKKITTERQSQDSVSTEVFETPDIKTD